MRKVFLVIVILSWLLTSVQQALSAKDTYLIMAQQDVIAKCADTAEFDLPAGAPFGPKYCNVRKRFFEKFFFDGAIAESIDGTTIKFSDHVAYMGFALVTFAGEAKILAEAGLSTKNSELAISRILAEYDKLDNEAEMRAYNTAESGFFIRDYVIPGERPNFSKLGIEGLRIKSDYSNTNKPRDKEMSKDQAVHILVGLWAVKRWSPDLHHNNRALAEQYTQRLIDFLKRERFYITLPNSDTPVARGPDAVADSGFLLNIAGQTLGQDQAYNAEVRWIVPGFDVNYHAETPKKCLSVWGVEIGCIPRIVWWDFDFEWDGGAIIAPVKVFHNQIVSRVNEHQSFKNIEIPIVPLDCVINNAVNDIVNDLNQSINDITRNIPRALRRILSIPEIPDLKAICIALTTYKTSFGDRSGFEYNLALLEFAFEKDILSSAFDRIAEECSDESLGGYGHIWAKLLRSEVRGVPVSNEVLVQANIWHDAGLTNGPVGDRTNNPIWFTDSRWIRCNSTSSNSRAIYNGLDFLSFDILMHMQPQNRLPEVYVAKQANSVELGTSEFPYDTISEGIQAAQRLGKHVVRINGGNYSEGEIISSEYPVLLVGNDGGVVQIQK